MNTLFPREISSSDDSNEWYTPARYIEAARRMMGGEIDLDPASCEEANQVVRAATYYTIHDDGLSQTRSAFHVWLNPPYGLRNGKSHQGLFITKLDTEYKLGNIKQSVLLTTLRTDASWFQLLFSYAFCIVDHQILFHRPGRRPEHNIHGSMLVYLGPHIQRFIDHFTRFGPVITPDGIDRIMPPVVQPSLLDREAAS